MKDSKYENLRKNYGKAVTEAEFAEIMAAEQLSFSYVEMSGGYPCMRYDILVKDCEVTVMVVDMGMGRATRIANSYPTREDALGHALERMREYKKASENWGAVK